MKKKNKKKVDDKIKQLKEKEVEELLFSDYLNNINNKKNGLTTIHDYFTYT